MTVRILISRTITKEQGPVVRPLLKELHSHAVSHKGYVSGESLISAEDLEDNLIISTWESLNYWEDYQESRESQDLRFKIDQILSKPSSYKVYFTR